MKSDQRRREKKLSDNKITMFAEGFSLSYEAFCSKSNRTVFRNIAEIDKRCKRNIMSSVSRQGPDSMRRLHEASINIQGLGLLERADATLKLSATLSLVGTSDCSFNIFVLVSIRRVLFGLSTKVTKSR